MIYLVSDHAGFDLKEAIKARFDKINAEYIDLSAKKDEMDDYSDQAQILADTLKEDGNATGIAICGTGLGMCIALNRHKWIRAVTGQKREIIRLSRSHNNANVLCLPGRFMTPTKAMKLIKVFRVAPFSKEERHTRRLDKIS